MFTCRRLTGVLPESRHQVWKQIRELEKLTSVSATIETETSAMSDDAKLQIVMAGSSRFEAQAASLKELKATKECGNFDVLDHFSRTSQPGTTTHTRRMMCSTYVPMLIGRSSNWG